MGTLEHHDIDEILRTHNVNLPAEVVEALATAFRSALLTEDVAAEEYSEMSGRGGRVIPPEVHTVDVLSIRPVVNGEAQPCLRALIHGHFMRTYFGRGRAAARKAFEATNDYLAAIAVEPARTQTPENETSAKATPSPASGVEEGSEGVQRGLACAADICQTYVDSADNYQKRLAAFQCVKRIREAIATFSAVEAVRAKVRDTVCTARGVESAVLAG